MNDIPSAGMSWWDSVLYWLDPLCGKIGLFTWLGEGHLLSCGDTGWGDELASGVLITVTLAIATLPIGVILGFLIALAMRSQEKSLRLAAGIYTTIFRGLPELLTLFIIYYGAQILVQSLLASFGYDQGVEINAFVAGMVALGVVNSSYFSEVIYAAMQAIPNGQFEASASLGLSRARTYRLVIIPQLVRIALPGATNLWMILLKDTSYVSIVGLAELLRQTSVAVRVTKQAFFFYSIACLIYLVLAVLSSFALRYIENWAKRSEVSR
jgi:polar amino acid transport system permease protein